MITLLLFIIALPVILHIIGSIMDAFGAFENHEADKYAGPYKTPEQWAAEGNELGRWTTR